MFARLSVVIQSVKGYKLWLARSLPVGRPACLPSASSAAAAAATGAGCLLFLRLFLRPVVLVCVCVCVCVLPLCLGPFPRSFFRTASC